LVYSIHAGERRAVRVREAKRLPVSNHRVVRMTLEDGRTIAISGEHPLANGSKVADVRAGSLIHGVRVLAVEVVPYGGAATFDILPESDTGTYFAAGMLVGSTMFGAVRVPEQSFLP
jgi:hypothetical protein